MGDMSAVESGITRQLQHAILQLCNEHVTYEHTLQVLGVVCITVDDRPRDIVIKLNNTLKRVDAVAPARDHNRTAGVRSSAAATLWTRAAPGSVEPASSSRANGTGGVGSSMRGEGGRGDQVSGTREACTDHGSPVAMLVGARKCHGRKQSNPVKVKAVTHDNREDDDDIDDDDDDRDDASSEVGGNGVLLIAPAEPSAGNEEFNANPQPPSLRLSHDHSDCSEDSPRNRRNQLDLRASAAVGGTSAVRALLTGKLTEPSRGGVSSDGFATPRSLISSPLVDTVSDPIVVMPAEYMTPLDAVADRLRRDSLNNDEQQIALNFSTRQTPDRRRRSADSDSSPDCPGGGTDVHIKQELQQQHSLPLQASYGGPGHVFDMSSSMSVAAAAAAFSQYVDDPAVLETLSSYDQQRLAFYTSLVTAAAAGVPPANADDGPSTMLNGSRERSPLRLDNHSAGTSNSRHSDGQTMNRMPAGRRRAERFSHQCLPPVKVKDIIMYDDSAPLHVQRGSRIEGDFMLDALHVEGRKRRRRTAEDTLTPEEIAEYMGTSTSSGGGGGQFACRYCGEVSADLSRYFAHTLTSHGSFVCHQCGKSFTTKSSLLRHRPIHTGMRRFACSICRKAFYRKDKCKAHIKRHLGLADGPAGPSQSPAGLPQTARPVTPHLLSSVDQQLMTSSGGPVNLAVV